MSTACPERRGATSTDVSEVKQAVDRALPIVRAHATAADATGGSPTRWSRRCASPGSTACLPAEMGGIEAGVDDIMDIVGRIAMVDGSTAWCAVIGTGSNVFSGYLPPSGASRVFADPDQGNATMFAPGGGRRDGGGYRLSGRWPFTSNCLHSAWIGLGTPCRRVGSGPRSGPRVAFVHASDVTIEDTWRFAGLRAPAATTSSPGCRRRSRPLCVFTAGRGPRALCGGCRSSPSSSRCWPPSPLASPVARSRRWPTGPGGSYRPAGPAGRRPDRLMAGLGIAASRLGGAARGCARRCARPAPPAVRAHRPGLQAKVCLAAQVASDVAVEATATAHQVGGGAARTRAARCFGPSGTWRRRASTSCSPTSTAAN